MTYDEIYSQVKDMLSTKRFSHSEGVVHWAEILSKKYNEDINKSRIAAIAHDCAKEFSNEELIKICKEKGIPINIIAEAHPQLLHGVVGRVIAKEKFMIQDEDVLTAIEYHTTGRSYMSLLEKIIYLSDMIEEGRKYQGVEIIRDKALVDLNEALLLAFDRTICHVVENRGLIHIDTIEGRNCILLKK